MLFKIHLHSDIKLSVEKNGFVFLGGDFNFAKEGCNDVDHHFPMASTVPDEPTHYAKGSGRLSFIDRGAFSCPAWATPLFDTSFAFFARPTTLSALGLSDHGI